MHLKRIFIDNSSVKQDTSTTSLLHAKTKPPILALTSEQVKGIHTYCIQNNIILSEYSIEAQAIIKSNIVLLMTLREAGFY